MIARTFLLRHCNLSNRVFSENEINVLEKALDFAPIHQKNNEPQLHKDFEEFCRH